MKLYAQDGFGSGERLVEGFSGEVIDGAVFSARYRHPARFPDKADDLMPFGGDLLMDPEYYAIHAAGSPNAKLGSLEEWDYFSAPRRSALITGAAIAPAIEATYKCQLQFEHLSGLIAPNVYVETADSIDAAIALNFINQTKPVYEIMGITGKELFASLVLDRDVLTAGAAFTDLLGALTGLSASPDGFYLLVGSGTAADDGRYIRSDLYHDHVIAGWMMINYVLSLNGFKVISGCSDLLTPLLGICGAYAGASGWSTSLRQFSMGRYIKPKSAGGSPPAARYVSNPLLARIRHTDLDNYQAVEPNVLNGLPSDAFYQNVITRQEETIQSWAAIKELSTTSVSGDINADLDQFLERIASAEHLWNLLAGSGLSAGVEAHLERLRAMRNGIQLFTEWAELT